MSLFRHLPFWSAVLLTILGTIITFVPGGECGWFLLVPALSVAGLFIPKTSYRIATAALLIFALKAAYDGYQGGIRYRERPSSHSHCIVTPQSATA